MLSVIKAAILSDQVAVTEHAQQRTHDNDLSLEQIYESVIAGEVIETYTDDPRGDSCLVLGVSRDGVAIHSVWAYHKNTRGKARLVTIYCPSLNEWEDDLRTRKRERKL